MKNFMAIHFNGQCHIQTCFSIAWMVWVPKSMHLKTLFQHLFHAYFVKLNQIVWGYLETPIFFRDINLAYRIPLDPLLPLMGGRVFFFLQNRLFSDFWQEFRLPGALLPIFLDIVIFCFHLNWCKTESLQIL